MGQIYAGVNNLAYKIDKAYAGVGNIAHKISKAYAGVDGIARQIWSGVDNSRILKNLPLGTVIKINFNNALKDFTLIHKGSPSGQYINFENGVILLSNKGTARIVYGSNAYYETSNLHTYLNSTFLSGLDSIISNSIKQVKIPYVSNGFLGPVLSGENGLLCSVFELSTNEIGFDDNRNIGMLLPYMTDSNIRINQELWWTRCPYPGNGIVYTVNTNGAMFSQNYNVAWFDRAAFVLPDNIPVNLDGTLNV